MGVLEFLAVLWVGDLGRRAEARRGRVSLRSRLRMLLLSSSRVGFRLVSRIGLTRRRGMGLCDSPRPPLSFFTTPFPISIPFSRFRVGMKVKSGFLGLNVLFDILPESVGRDLRFLLLCGRFATSHIALHSS